MSANLSDDYKKRNVLLDKSQPVDPTNHSTKIYWEARENFQKLRCFCNTKTGSLESKITLFYV